MDTLMCAIQDNNDIAMTILRGMERSRFLLRCAFNLLIKDPRYKIYHVLESDQQVDRVYKEAKRIPFKEFGPKGIRLAKCKGSANETEVFARLVVCSLAYLIRDRPAKIRSAPKSTFVVMFDMKSLDTFEEIILSVQEPKGVERYRNILHALSEDFHKASIVAACNGPLDGILFQLGYNFPIALTEYSHADFLRTLRDKSFASIVTTYGAERWPMVFNGDLGRTNELLMHNKVGTILESLLSLKRPGGTIVFFPSYDMMLRYHMAWRRLGIYERISVTVERESRNDSNRTKQGLYQLAQKSRHLYLCCIRSDENEELLDVSLGQVGLVLIVGLPYPSMDYNWQARLSYMDRVFREFQEKGRCPRSHGVPTGPELYKTRAIDFMNGMIKRCLVNEYRTKPCHFFILDRDLQFSRDKLAKELGDVRVERFDKALARFMEHKV